MLKRKLRAAEAYMARGWQVFTVSGGKRPWNNCDWCRTDQHDPEACTCLDCHAFYAASLDINRVRASLWLHGQETMLAVRTGATSGIIAIDAEGDDKDGYGKTGIEVLDEWQDWVDGAPLGETLRASTAGGGVHLLYQYREGVSVASRNRVLPNVDIKADGGYIVVGPGGGRSWLNWGQGEWADRLETPGDALLAFMTSASGSSTGSTGSNGQASNGLRLSLRKADIIPAGSRYEFTRDLVYHLRKQGYEWSRAVEICEGYWARYEQPPAGVRIAGGVWFLPFTQVMYELERVWKRVEPDAPVSFTQMAWARKQHDQE